MLERLAEGLVLVDESGTITEWNRAMEQITGLGCAHAVGRSVWAVYDAHVVPEAGKTASVKPLVKALIRRALRDATFARTAGADGICVETAGRAAQSHAH